MSAQLDCAPDLATLLWEADRLSELDLEPDQRRWFVAIVDYLERVWPYDDGYDGDDSDDVGRDALVAALGEHWPINEGEPDDEKIVAAIRLALQEARAEGEKDATVPSRASTAERKAMRLLLERRLVVTRRESKGELAGLIVATCRGDSGTYDLGYDPRPPGRWRCTCPELRGECSHLAALKMIV